MQKSKKYNQKQCSPFSLGATATSLGQIGKSANLVDWPNATMWLVLLVMINAVFVCLLNPHLLFVCFVIALNK